VDIGRQVENNMSFGYLVDAASRKCQASRKTTSAVNVKRYVGTAVLLASYVVL